MKNHDKHFIQQFANSYAKTFDPPNYIAARAIEAGCRYWQHRINDFLRCESTDNEQLIEKLNNFYYSVDERNEKLPV